MTQTDRDTPTHAHEYKPNGLVRENAVSRSPVSELDHHYYVKVFSIGLCSCGAVTKKHVSNEGGESGLERLRRCG